MIDQNCIDILSRLIEFKSISRNSNLDIAEYVAQFATSRGAWVKRFPSADGAKEGLLIGIGPQVEGGLLFSGHMDVVPVDEQVWISDPFRLRQAGDRLHGRGATDMKGFLAICLSVLGAINAVDLKRPLFLSFTHDEEIACENVQQILAYLKSNTPTPAAVIVGEPTEMRMVAAHKGALDWIIEVHGKAAHSSLPHLGANAIYAAARMIGQVEVIEQELKQCSLSDCDLYDVPFTTLSAGLISGGTAGNIIPSYCKFQIGARTIEPAHGVYIRRRLEEFAQNQVGPFLRATAPAAHIVITAAPEMPPFVRQRSSEAELLVAKLSGSSKVEAVSYATEAGFFQAAGLSTVVFGPGSIEQAHQPDEFITMDQLMRGRTAVHDLVATLAV